MQGTRYFKTLSGHYVADHEVRRAFDICGYYFGTEYDVIKEDDFIEFLVFNRDIMPVEPLTDEVVRDILKVGQTACAASVYRDIHNCSLMEAYETVKSYQKED